MAMTAAVKDEISRLPVTRTCCRKAEVSAVLRFAGGLHLVSGRIVIEAELDTARAARRLKQDILEIFGHGSELIVMAPARPPPRPAPTAAATPLNCGPPSAAWTRGPVSATSPSC